MAMANVNNSNRASGFIRRAVDFKTNASPRERLWIDAYTLISLAQIQKPIGEKIS
jgi:hypothetical protein